MKPAKWIAAVCATGALLAVGAAEAKTNVSVGVSLPGVSAYIGPRGSYVSGYYSPYYAPAPVYYNAPRTVYYDDYYYDGPVYSSYVSPIIYSGYRGYSAPVYVRYNSGYRYGGGYHRGGYRGGYNGGHHHGHR